MEHSGVARSEAAAALENTEPNTQPKAEPKSEDDSEPSFEPLPPAAEEALEEAQRPFLRHVPIKYSPSKTVFFHATPPSKPPDLNEPKVLMEFEEFVKMNPFEVEEAKNMGNWVEYLGWKASCKAPVKDEENK
jgi:hypothetical protein